jgi:hypothetical protein
MDLLQHYGCWHATSWGDGHIFTFASGGNAAVPRRHMMLDAPDFVGFRGERKGNYVFQKKKKKKKKKKPFLH